MNKLLTHLCGALAAAALFAIMALTFFDVIGRKAASASIPGAFELTELLMVVVIFAALPLVSQRGEHVVFDSLDGFWGQALVRLQKAVIHAVCAAVLLALAYAMWQTGAQFAANGDETAGLKIAKAPFVYGMALACGLTGLVHLAHMIFPAADPNNETTGEGVAL